MICKKVSLQISEVPSSSHPFAVETPSVFHSALMYTKHTQMYSKQSLFSYASLNSVSCKCILVQTVP